MDILGFFQGLDTFQKVLLAAGAFLLWPTIQQYLGNFWNGTEEDEAVEPNKPKPKPTPEYDHESELAELVCKWECLIDGCHEHELAGACDKLKEIFPLLVDAHKDEGHDVKPESGVTT